MNLTENRIAGNRHLSNGQHTKPDIAPVSIGSLMRDYPRLNEPIVDGLLRRGETANLIAASKMGKTWAAYGLSFAMVTGGRWLDRFQCCGGKVLLIDNELHPATLAHRLGHVADVLGIYPEHYTDAIDVLPLRGRLQDLRSICKTVKRVERGQYALIILDAWYRAIPQGTSENDNAQVQALYNEIDHAAEHANVGWFNVHHASKGSQSEKALIDVGAGAGSQSRAADCHLALRPHEDEGVVVLEAAVRSFAPVEPLPLRWEFPLWVPCNADPTRLKGRLAKAEERAQAKDKAGLNAILDALRHAGEPLPTKRLKAEAGMGLDRCERLLAALVKDGHVKRETRMVKGNESTFWSLQHDKGSIGSETFLDP